MTAIDHDMPKYQSDLRDSNMNSINYVNAAPLCCCEGVETDHEIRPMPARKIVAAFVLAVALAISVARAAELPTAYEIVAYRAGKDLRTDEPNIIPLPDSRHDSRELCRHAIQFVKVQESGMRLRCDKIDDRRVR